MLYKKPGDKVRRGDVIARIFTDKEYAIEDAARMILDSLTYTDKEAARGTMIYDVIR